MKSVRVTPSPDETTNRREINRRGLLAAGTGAVGAMFATSPASGLLAENEEGASGNFVAARVVSSAEGVLYVERVDNGEALSVVIDLETRLPDPTLARAARGRIVGINASNVAQARARSQVRATVVAPCVLGQLSEAEKREDVPS